MNIVTSLPRRSDGEIHDAFMKEIINGFKLERERERERERLAHKEAKSFHGKSSKALGKCVASIPTRDWFRLQNKYGRHEIHSDEFLKYFQKKHPELSPNKL